MLLVFTMIWLKNCSLGIKKTIIDLLTHPLTQTIKGINKYDLHYSEGTRQQLEAMRQEKINHAASVIQANWRGFKCRLEWVTIRPKLVKHRENMKSPKPQLQR